MLRRSGPSLVDRLLLRVSGNDPIRADELKSRLTRQLLGFVLSSYIPLIVVVGFLATHRPAPVNIAAQADRKTAVEAFATEFIDAYLQGPFNSEVMNNYCVSEIPTPRAGTVEQISQIVPPGGRALHVSSALPGPATNGFQTWSVIVNAEIPKAANASAMVPIRFQVNIAIDRNGYFCVTMLPNKRFERPSGKPVELVAQTQVADDRPLYQVVKGFLSAMLTGQGDITPYVSAQSNMRSTPGSTSFATMSITKVLANSEAATAQDVPPKSGPVEVTANVIVETASGIPMPMQFPLLMSVASGHWQVDAINDSPSINVPQDSGFSSPSTTTARPSNKEGK